MDESSTFQLKIQNEQEQGTHLRDYIRVLLKRKTTVLTFLVITLLTSLIITYTAPPIYTASSQVLIERNYGSSAIERTMAFIPYDPEFLSTQFELICSSNVALRVVERLELDTKYKHYFLSKQKKGFFSFISSFKNESTNFIKDFTAPDSGNMESKQSNTNLLTQPSPVANSDIIASIIQSNISITPVVDTKTVFISYNDKNPAMAKLVIDAVIQSYKDEILEIKLASSSYSLQWMTSKADEERKKLENSELALQRYMRENDLVTVENRLAVYPQKLSEFSSQLSKAQAEQKEYESLTAQIKLSGKDYNTIETISVFAENIALQNLREKVFAAEQKIKDLSKKYGYRHPVMINAKAEHALLIKEKKFEISRIIEATENAYELAKSRENNLRQLLSNTKQEMLNVNERFTQYSIMKREVDLNRVLYDALTSSIKTASVTEQSQDVKIWVIKKAVFPGVPSKPDKKRNLALSLIAGLLGGIGLAFFIEYLDNSVKDGRDIEQRFGLTVLGTIEEIQNKNDDIDTFLLEQPLSPLAENYRMIRSALLFSAPDHPPKTILITSMLPKEGKTSTTCNLARVLSQNDRKVLIIDCDMRRPRTHSLFNLPNSTGLSSYLTGNAEVKGVIKEIPDALISLITSGPIPPNPAELLHSNKMQVLMQEMMKRFDFVLLDSPPVQRVTDSLTLSTLVDGVIIVTRSTKTTYDMLESGLKKMHELHAPILGVIVNGLVKSKKSSSYYGYYEYYNKE